MRDHRIQWTADITAVDTDALVDRLNDLAWQIAAGKHPSKSVFGSPSSSGIVTLQTVDDAERTEAHSEQGRSA